MVNKAFEQITGATQAMVIGKTDGDFMHADLAEGCRKTDEEIMKSSGQLQLEDVLVGEDGRKTYLESVKVPVKDPRGHLLGLVGVTRDVTARKQAEKTLRAAVSSALKEKARTEAVISAIGDGLLILDDEFKIVYQNEVLREMAGNLVGEICYKTVDERDFICEDCPVELSFKDGLIHRAERTRTTKDAAIHIEMTSSPLRDAFGKIIAVIEIVRDVTERKNTEEVLRRSHEELEILVNERTAELMVMNDQLRNFSMHLQNVRENERTSIAREIHDDLGQTLTALKMDLSFLRKRLPGDQMPVIEKAESMAGLIDTTIQSVKRISTELRPGILDHLGLCAAIEWQAREFEKRSGISCEIVFEPEEIELDKNRSTTVFRIFQETLTNVARHAKATKISVLLQEQTADLLLQIRDNGIGITESAKNDPKSLGLIGIRERVNYWGGSLSIDGTPDQGTTVTVQFPLDVQG